MYNTDDEMKDIMNPYNLYTSHLPLVTLNIDTNFQLQTDR